MYYRLASAWNAAFPLWQQTHGRLIGRDGHFLLQDSSSVPSRILLGQTSVVMATRDNA